LSGIYRRIEENRKESIAEPEFVLKLQYHSSVHTLSISLYQPSNITYMFQIMNHSDRKQSHLPVEKSISLRGLTSPFLQNETVREKNRIDNSFRHISYGCDMLKRELVGREKSNISKLLSYEKNISEER